MPVVQGQVHVGAYQVLVDVLASNSAPPGARGTLYSIIDDLRSSLRPIEGIRRAERVSIAIHQLETAIQGRDDVAAQDARAKLKSLAVAWPDARISARQCTPAVLELSSNIFNFRGYELPAPLFHCS